jgi:phosphoribosylanthranilate isomerase
MWIKICGITRLQDAVSAARFGADAVGFIFADSPREVTPEQAREIARAMPAGPERVGVFVNRPLDEVEEIVDYCGLDLIQLHGDEDPAYCSMLGGRAIKALRVTGNTDLVKVDKYSCRAVLLDGFENTGHGAEGNGFDWRMVGVIDAGRPIIVAGGLTHENVGKAITTARPFGVDVSSGVETAPGIKDPVLIYRFIEKARKVAYEVNKN